MKENRLQDMILSVSCYKVTSYNEVANSTHSSLRKQEDVHSAAKYSLPPKDFLRYLYLCYVDLAFHKIKTFPVL